MSRFLNPEDYLEPVCIFCRPDQDLGKPIDLRRFLTKLDEHLSRRDYDAARRHLDYWRAEAEACNDPRGRVTIENEAMGLFRKIGLEDEAMEAAEAARALLDRAGLTGTVTAATTALNIATVHKRFGRPEQALALYEQAAAIYERNLAPEDERLGGLYNNMGLALTDLGRFDEALALYEKALAVMAKAPNGKPEMAITELNLANLWEAKLGLLEAESEIEGCLDRARALLEDPKAPRDGNYAFVCEKCAPTFGYYGRFADARELEALAEEIYGRA